MWRLIVTDTHTHTLERIVCVIRKPCDSVTVMAVPPLPSNHLTRGGGEWSGCGCGSRRLDRVFPEKKPLGGDIFETRLTNPFAGKDVFFYRRLQDNSIFPSDLSVRVRVCAWASVCAYEIQNKHTRRKRTSGAWQTLTNTRHDDHRGLLEQGIFVGK